VVTGSEWSPKFECSAGRTVSVIVTNKCRWWQPSTVQWTGYCIPVYCVLCGYS